MSAREGLRAGSCPDAPAFSVEGRGGRRGPRGPLLALVGLAPRPAQWRLMPRDPEPQLYQGHAWAVLNLSAVELERSPHDPECHIDDRAHEEVWAYGPLVSRA